MTTLSPPLPAETPTPLGKAPLGRLPRLDMARGLALVAMFVFHFAYDLSFFGLIATDVPRDPGWSLFARAIASSFLALVGISLVLATRRGIDWGGYWRHLGMIVAAAALVTLATWYALPNGFIFFGILHHIAVASLLGLAFLRWPPLALFAAAAVAVMLPRFIAAPFLDAPWLAWLGFSRGTIVSADFVPLFPWFGAVLAGMGLGRLIVDRGPPAWLSGDAPGKPGRLLALAGRHSLGVYLVHQPVFFAVLWLYVTLSSLPGAPSAEAEPFVTACRKSCVATSKSAETCRTFCDCTVDGLKRENLWDQISRDIVNEATKRQADAVVQACLKPPAQ